jgi:hypothetical protein
MAKVSFDNSAKVTQDKPVKPIEAYKNLVVGEIISVELTSKISESKTGYQFTGYEVPNLVIRFKQKIDAFNKEDRYSVWVFKPVVSMKNDGTKMADDVFQNLVMNNFNHLKHILDTYETLPNFKKLGKLPDIDSDADTEVLLEQQRKFFETFLKAFEGKDGNGVYKGVEVVVKFIVNKNEKRLYIPSFVNRGFIELAKWNNKTSKLMTSLEFYGETTKIPEGITAPNAAGMPNNIPTAAAATIDLNDV